MCINYSSISPSVFGNCIQESLGVPEPCAESFFFSTACRPAAEGE